MKIQGQLGVAVSLLLLTGCDRVTQLANRTGERAPAPAPSTRRAPAPPASPVLPAKLPAPPAGGAGGEPAHVSFVEGDVYVKGGEDAEWSAAGENVPLYAGDGLWVDEGGRAEVEIARGVFLWSTAGTKVTLTELAPDVVLSGEVGAFRVEVGAEAGKDVRLDAPGASLSLRSGAEIRVDIAEDGYTRYTVLAGSCDVSSPDRVTVPASRRFYVEPGSLPSDSEPLARSDEDDFDGWVQERDGVRRTSCASCARTGVAGAERLDGYGSWVRYEGQEYWAPRVDASWRPYANGYWSYAGPTGYVWVSSDPFGWTTHHYGSWTFGGSHGWLWAPAHVWAPHHCYIARQEGRVFWAPLGPTGHPVFLGRADFHLAGGIAADFRAWSFLPEPAFVSGSRSIGLVHGGMFRGGVAFQHLPQPHMMLKAGLHARTPFLLTGRGVKVHTKASSLGVHLKGVPAPGFHGHHGKVMVKSRPMNFKLHVKGGGGPKLHVAGGPIHVKGGDVKIHGGGKSGKEISAGGGHGKEKGGKKKGGKGGGKGGKGK